MKLDDATVFLGRDAALEPFQYSDLDSVRRMLDRYGVRRALLFSFASFRLNMELGNEITFEAAAKDDRLIPCPTVLSDSGGEIGNEKKFVRRLVRRGARAVGFYPRSCGIAPDDRTIGKLFKALEECRLPVVVQREEMDAPEAAELAARYPGVPVICGAPNYRHRNLYPALERAENIYLTIAAPFAPNEGIESIVRRFGSRRLLFASNFPVCEPGAAIGNLCYADIGDKDRENIAFRNMERLVGEVRDEQAD